MLTTILVEVKRAIAIVMDEGSILAIRSLDIDMLPFETYLPPLNPLP